MAAPRAFWGGYMRTFLTTYITESIIMAVFLTVSIFNPSVPVASPNSILFVLLQDLDWVQLPVPIPVEQCNALAEQWMATEPKVIRAFCVDPGVEV